MNSRQHRTKYKIGSGQEKLFYIAPKELTPMKRAPKNDTDELTITEEDIVVNRIPQDNKKFHEKRYLDSAHVDQKVPEIETREGQNRQNQDQESHRTAAKDNTDKVRTRGSSIVISRPSSFLKFAKEGQKGPVIIVPGGGDGSGRNKVRKKKRVQTRFVNEKEILDSMSVPVSEKEEDGKGSKEGQGGGEHEEDGILAGRTGTYTATGGSEKRIQDPLNEAFCESKGTPKKAHFQRPIPVKRPDTPVFYLSSDRNDLETEKPKNSKFEKSEKNKKKLKKQKTSQSHENEKNHHLKPGDAVLENNQDLITKKSQFKSRRKGYRRSKTIEHSNTMRLNQNKQKLKLKRTTKKGPLKSILKRPSYMVNNIANFYRFNTPGMESSYRSKEWAEEEKKIAASRQESVKSKKNVTFNKKKTVFKYKKPAKRSKSFRRSSFKRWNHWW